jgi:putative ABC transport system permease protein
MFRNYLKIAWRNISRKRLYTAINVSGLGMASAVCILIYWHVQYEQSFDRFHPNINQLYLVEFSSYPGEAKEKPKEGLFSFLNKNEGEDNMIVTPVILAGKLKKNFAEIQDAVRISQSYQTTLRVNNRSFKEERSTAYVDTDFFQTFYYPLKQGNPENVLVGHNRVVLSEKAAAKYFGNANAIGKTIMFTSLDSTLFTVSGVVKDFPANSSFHFDILMPRESVPGYNEDVNAGLNRFKDLLVIQLRKGTDEAVFAQKIAGWWQKYYGAFAKDFANGDTKVHIPRMLLRPYADAHYMSNNSWGHYTDVKSIFQLSCLAVIILLIACLNYILLTLTGTVSRSQEVGIRKTFGAPRKQIVLQFYIETQALIFIAVIVGFVLAIICLPVFNSLTGAQLHIAFFSFKDVAAMLVALAVSLGAIAGIYPALVMSGLKAINMMRKFATYRLNPVLSKVLIVTQFSVCIILIISSLVISRQMRYMNEKSLGFDKDQVLSVENPFAFEDDNTNSYLLKNRLYNYAAGDPAIEGITSSSTPFEGYGNVNTHIIGGERKPLEVFDIDYNYFSVFKIPIIKGRVFSPNIASDSVRIILTDDQHMKEASSARQAVVVNETLYNMLRRPALNVINREMGGVIIGVCKDYHSDDLTKKIAPVYHRIMKGYIGYFSVKIKAGQNIPQVMDRLKTNWAKLTGGEAFSYSFLDEKLAKSYEAYLRWMKTIFVSCFLAIVIACMGLFGLSGLTAVSRIKEIGIRKVMGASVNQLFVLLNRSTCIMAGVSFIVAVPLAIIFSNQWLQNFAYRITLDWSVFVIAGVISIATALLSVSYHTIKAARSNPVKSLRTE